jgi:hypothetical protein
MKKSYLALTTILLGFLAAPLQAGTETYKQVTQPPPPPEYYGLGFYGAIDMGANVYQNRGGTRTFTADDDFWTEPIGILMLLWRFRRRMTLAFSGH